MIVCPLIVTVTMPGASTSVVPVIVGVVSVVVAAGPPAIVWSPGPTVAPASAPASGVPQVRAATSV